MKVLIACEESQEVCKAFRARGHEAYSCDLIEPSGGHPEWHILGDALKALEGGASRDDGRRNARRWQVGLAHCTPALHVSEQRSNTLIQLACHPGGKGCCPVGRARKSRNFLYAVHVGRCPQNCSREPCRHHEHGVQKSRPDHSSVLLCRKRRGHGELSHKAHLPLAEKPTASGAEKQFSTARARVRLKWGKTQENQLVRRHTQHAQRSRGPGKSQKQNRTRNCESNGRTMGVNR